MEGCRRCSVFGWLMVRLLYIVGISSVLASCGVFGLCAWKRGQVDPRCEAFLRGPSAVQRFLESAGERVEEGEREVPPLVAQARLLEACLNPPKPVAEKVPEVVGAEGKREVSEAAPAVRPVAPSVTFKLHGTSCYPNQPDRSMALISEAGYAQGEERWVKEGTQLGHFVIHEIRKGMIVYRDGDQLREMTVERGASVPSLVRDMRSGSRQISGDMGVPSMTAPVPAGPNSAEIAGGD